MREYVVKNPHGRPNLFVMDRVEHAIVEGVKYVNSPFWHLRFDDINDFLI